jgi:hypothetical protein
LNATLVNVSLNGFTKAWESFITNIYAQEQLPKWERLWDNCIQEKTQKESRSRKQAGDGGDENLALVSKTKKGKGKFFVKKGKSQGEGKQFGQKRDMSKIKCYIFHNNGHFASQCPQRRKGESQTVVATIEMQLYELPSKFASDFSSMSCLSTNTTPNSAWYLDNGTSCHMTEAKDMFNNLLEEDTKLHI